MLKDTLQIKITGLDTSSLMGSWFSNSPSGTRFIKVNPPEVRTLELGPLSKLVDIFQSWEL